MPETTTKTRSRGPLGLTKSKKTSPPTAQKWSEGIAQQTKEAHKHVNVQFIPLTQIILDPENTRNITLTLDIALQGPKFNDFPLDEKKEQQLQEKLLVYFQNHINKDQIITDYFSLIRLTASIQSPDKLINPITVYLEEMTFHLIAGHRRTLAHALMGASEIAATIMPARPDKLARCILQWKENDDRENLSLAEQIAGIRKIIQAWEDEHNEQVSITKLMTIVNIKKTRAHWYLRIINDIANNKLLQDAITSNKISSLEVAYKIASINNDSEQLNLLNQLREGKKITYTTAKAQLKSENTDNVSGQENDSSNNGLMIKKKTNLTAIASILQAAVNNPELASCKEQIEQLDLSSKKGINQAWQQIYSFFDRKKTDTFVGNIKK